MCWTEECERKNRSNDRALEDWMMAVKFLASQFVFGSRPKRLPRSRRPRRTRIPSAPAPASFSLFLSLSLPQLILLAYILQRNEPFLPLISMPPLPWDSHSFPPPSARPFTPIPISISSLEEGGPDSPYGKSVTSFLPLSLSLFFFTSLMREEWSLN